MEFVSFNSELGIANILFSRVFSDIRIERTDKHGNKSWLKVPCVNAQRSRIIKNLSNRDRESMYKLPMIAFSRTGYTRQGERLNSLHNEIKYEITSQNRNLSLLTPVPIDISYDLTVFAKYQADIDKIASNFMVFFNSDIYVSQMHPKFEGVKLNNQIVMGDSVTEDHPDEFDGSQDDVITSTFNFTFKTYLFGGTKQFLKKKTTKHEISSFLSTVMSSYIHEFQDDDEILKFLNDRKNPDLELNKTAANSKLSTVIEFETQIPVTQYAEQEISSDQYDDGIPKINRIDFGVYAVPMTANIDNFITSVDNELIVKHEHYTQPAYISSEAYTQVVEVHQDEDGSSLSTYVRLDTHGDYYEPVDNWCTLAPYVDRLRWKIDANSTNKYPYNIRMYSDFES